MYCYPMSMVVTFVYCRNDKYIKIKNDLTINDRCEAFLLIHVVSWLKATGFRFCPWR